MASFTVLPLFSYMSYTYYFSTASASSSTPWSTASILFASFLVGYIPTVAINLHLSKTDGWLIKSVQKWHFWKRLVNFSFPGWSLTLEKDLDDAQLYIYCCFPHGTTSCNHMMTMTDACSMISKHDSGDRRDLAASVLFMIPFASDILLWLGCVDASSATAHHNLRRKRSLLIFVGGEREQLMTTEKKHKIYLQKRKGFIKLALQYGAHLVPMYCFGENECYSVSSFMLPFRQWVQAKFQIGIALQWGLWYFPIWAHATPLRMEIGAPMVVAKKAKEDITSEDVDALHAAFVKEQVRLFDRTKKKYGQEDAVLEIY